MTSEAASPFAPAQRMPAWKRLGLKLKEAASDSSPAPAATQLSSAQSSTANAQVNGHAASSRPVLSPNKRKFASATSWNSAPSTTAAANKKLRLDGPSHPQPGLKKQKSVTFAEDTKAGARNGKTTAASQKGNKKKNKSKPKKKAAAVAAGATSNPPNLAPSIAYLQQWKTAREAWKFNKNHQTLLIKYVFTSGCVPSSDVDAFYDYIHDIKGSVRDRLRERAHEVKKTDMERGKAMFQQARPEDDVSKMQTEYEGILSQMTAQQQQQQQQQQPPNVSGINGNGKRMRRISEVEYVMRVAHPEIRERLQKRIRAENIIGELSDSDESTSTGATTSTSGTSGTSGQDAADAETETMIKLNDGSQQKLKRKRSRKDRSGMLDDDETSSSESESDATSSSESSSGSSSSDEEEEDEEMPLALGQADIETSSSSSSSSSSSGSDGVSGSEVETGDEGGDADDSSEEEGDEEGAEEDSDEEEEL